MNIYFAGSITGGRADVKLYNKLIAFLKNYGNVPTEHVGDLALTSAGETTDAQEVYQRDLDWLNKADIMVAEVTQPSLGVGYELAYAQLKGTPVICLFRTGTGRNLTKLIRGNEYYEVFEYEQIDEAIKFLKDRLESENPEAV